MTDLTENELLYAIKMCKAYATEHPDYLPIRRQWQKRARALLEAVITKTTK